MVKVRDDLTGRTFGRLKVLYQTDDYVAPSGQHFAQYHCVCGCNQHNKINVLANNLKKHHTLSCGCLKDNKTSQRSKKYNDYKIVNDIVYIKLSNCDECAMVNLDKWNSIPYLRECCWRKSTNGYADATIPKKDVKKFNKRTIMMHQLICYCEDGYEPDHLDRNRLNNLTANLQPKTRSENNQNRGIQTNNQSGYTGVSWDKRLKKWSAKIGINNKYLHLGVFQYKKDAIKARRDAEKKYWNI